MKYKNEASQVLYEHAVELFKIVAITEARMREYDEMCLKIPKSKKASAVCSDGNSVNIKSMSHITA